MTTLSEDKKKPIIIKANSLDYDYTTGNIKGGPFEYDDYLECGACGCLVLPGSGNFYSIQCPICNVKWIKGETPVGYKTYPAIRLT